MHGVGSQLALSLSLPRCVSLNRAEISSHLVAELSSTCDEDVDCQNQEASAKEQVVPLWDLAGTAYSFQNPTSVTKPGPGKF